MSGGGGVKRFPSLLVAAWAIYAVAWFLPVIEGGTTLAKGGLPGWDAFRFALLELDSDAWGWLGRLTAVTNFLMVASPLVAARLPGRDRRRLGLGFLVCFALDSCWAWPVGDSAIADLRAGYWLWLGSYGLAAFALWRSPRPTAGADSRPPAPAWSS